jgi:hypothetical protein
MFEDIKEKVSHETLYDFCLGFLFLDMPQSLFKAHKKGKNIPERDGNT